MKYKYGIDFNEDMLIEVKELMRAAIEQQNYPISFAEALELLKLSRLTAIENSIGDIRNILQRHDENKSEWEQYINGQDDY